MSKTGKVILVVIGGVILVGVITVWSYFSLIRYRSSSTEPLNISLSSKFSQVSGQSTGRAEAADSISAPGLGSGVRPLSAPTPPSNGIKRLVIKTGNLSVVVKDVRMGIQKIAEYAEKNGGFVVASTVSKSGSAPVGTITIRIPSDTFDSGIREVKSFGEVVSEYTQGEDVTAEYVDLDAELRNLKATEEQFLTILKQATRIQDILEVQNQLSSIRGQIQVIQGRIQYLQKSADLSSLTITLSTDPAELPIVEKNTNHWKPGIVLKEAIRSLIEVGKELVNALIWIAIFTPLWGLLLSILFVVRQRIRQKKMSVK